MNAIEKNDIFFEEEQLDITKQVNEYLLTSIRTIEGTNLNLVKEKWGASAYLTIAKNAEKLVQQNLLISDDCYLRLSKNGKFLADKITVDLMLES